MTTPFQEYCTVPLTQGYCVVIDSVDCDKLAGTKWCAMIIRRKDGSISKIYAKRKLPGGKRGEIQLLHRLLMGVTGKDAQVDHINHDGLDCRRINMRVVTQSQNAHNCRSHVNSSSLFSGVTWDKERTKWLAQIKISGKNKFLGRFSTEQEAAHAYSQEAAKCF